MTPVIMFHGHDDKLADKLELIGCELDDTNQTFYWLGTLDDFADKYQASFQVYITAFGARRIFVTSHGDFRPR